jgi:predicted Zn-dependent peptidase
MIYTIEHFPNNLRLVTHSMNDRASVSVGIWVGVGGRHESDPLKGAAHFLEHIAFKGSKSFSADQIKKGIEGIGGAVNAFTSEEQTCFYAKTPAKYFPQVFDILADMACAPKMTPADFVQEKTVILEEIKMYHDLPQYLVMDTLDSLVWPGHPLGKNLAGTPLSVSSFTTKMMRDFHEQYYVPNNIVISVVGQVEHEDVARRIRSRFDCLQTRALPNFETPAPDQETPRLKFVAKSIEQMHIALGMLGYDEWHDDRHVLFLLAVILGGNMSSRLFSEIREKRGMAYSISASTKTLCDTGIFLVRAGIENRNITTGVGLILKELDKICRFSVRDEELRRGREYVLGQLRLNLEDTMEEMLYLGESVMTKNNVRTFGEIAREFRSITPADLKRVARVIFYPQRYNFAVVGPVTEAQEQPLRKMFSV